MLRTNSQDMSPWEKKLQAKSNICRLNYYISWRSCFGCRWQHQPVSRRLLRTNSRRVACGVREMVMVMVMVKITSAPSEATALVAKDNRKKAGRTDRSRPPIVRLSLPLPPPGRRPNTITSHRPHPHTTTHTRKRWVGVRKECTDLVYRACRTYLIA